MENNTSLKTSVVLATYNGQEYIEEQLDSIYKQSQQADEVLIFDDRSTDNTVQICKNFIQEKQLENWSIKVNEIKLGVFHNFINAVHLANGEVIFFADQDDVWLEHKISVMVNEFKKNTDILSLTSTFSRFNENVALSKHVKHPNRKRNGLKKISLHKFCTFPYYLGMSMAVSKNLTRLINIQKDLENEVTHDIYLNFYSVQNYGLYHLDRVLTKRRSYDGSVSNTKAKNNLVNFNNNIKLCTVSDKLMMFELFKKDLKNSNNNKGIAIQNSIKVINKHQRFNHNRFNYLNDNNILNWLKSIVFLNYYNSFLSYLNDGFEIVNSGFKIKKNRNV